MLVDTNIIVYAINADSPKNNAAKKFLNTYKNSLEIAHQNIFESLRVLTHSKFSNPMEPDKAQKFVLEIVQAFRIIIPDHKTHYLAMELIKENKLLGNRIFDAYLAATAMSNGIIQIATDNEKDFKKLGISVFDPFKIE